MTSPSHSIRRKLTGIIMLTSTIAVLLACLGFVVSDLVSLRQRLSSDLSTLAEVVGSNSTAALTFEDREAAHEALSALRVRPSIIAACIYTEEGRQFAHYSPNASILPPNVPPKAGFHRRGDRLEFVYDIRLDGQRLGTLYIASDARERNARLKQYGLIAAGIVLASLLIAFVLSSRLQRSISAPIVELARVARVVSQHKDFSVRATHGSSHDSAEIGNLMSGFNGMLAEIEQRDDRLLRNQTELEETVALRTRELTAANENLLVAKNSAERIAETNAQLARESALILNSATDGIMGIGLDDRATFLNPAGARILGVTLDDLQEISLFEVVRHWIPGASLTAEADGRNAAALRGAESTGVAVDTFWRRDGTSFPGEYSSTPMFAEGGSQIGSVMLFRDVTERRAIERLKSEFVSTVSHELRTPLTSIRGALGLLSSGLLGPIAEKGQRMLEIAVSNTDRLVRLINDILDLERIESGKVELTRQAVDAGAVMLQALEGVQSIADQAGVRLVLEPAAGALWGDNDRIMQALTNLLGNAIKFSPPDTTVTLDGFANGSQFVFRVSDEGRGVPEDKLESIFGRFSQVDASDSRDKGGSGLGLAISQSIVNAHGGRIWAEKNEPAGTRFQFTIPLTLPDLVHAVELACDAPSVLVVEDDPDLARVMMTALQGHGFRTFHASTGADAVQLCRQHQPSLIVLDLLLPDMDGFAVVSALRQSPALAHSPLVVYSALDLGSADQSRLRLGLTEFLTKSRCSLADFEGHVVRLLETVTHTTGVDQDAA